MWIRDAVHKESADTISAFKDSYPVTRFIELRCAGKPSRPRTHNSYLLSRSFCGRLWNYPSLFKALVNNGAFNVFNRNRRLVNSENTCCLTWCRADPACELREIVSLVQTIERFSPETAVDQVVPFRNKIVDWAAGGHTAKYDSGVAEGYTTVHTASTLST